MARDEHRRRARKRVWAFVVGVGVILSILVSLKALVGWPDDGDAPQPLSDVRIDLAASLLDPEDSDPSSEYVCLVNASDDPVQLVGWELRDPLEQSVTLGELLLKPQAGVRVHTGSRSRSTASDQFGELGRPIWNDAGDTVELTDAEDRRIDERSYGEGDLRDFPADCGNRP